MKTIRTQGSDSDDWIPRLCTHNDQPYAILSHRWLEDPNHEILFADIAEIDVTFNQNDSESWEDAIVNSQYLGVNPRNKPGFKKLQGAAQQALKDGYDYLWIDTCCIDKNSSAELSEAINSMWMWYSSANVCYVYLADVQETTYSLGDSSLASSRWWTRGWTLQELLAPQDVVFFSSTWMNIGHKKSLDIIISDITGIDPNVINGTLSLDSFSIAQRMSWASGRTTTRIEDIAYSLMGIFGVNMPLLYGEGEKAFIRLQQEIMKDSDDETIFAWKDESIGSSNYSGLLASRPAAFASCGKVVQFQDAEHKAPYNITNKGLSIALPLFRTQGNLFRAKLHCADFETGNGNIDIYLRKISETSEHYARVFCESWGLTEPRAYNEPKTIYIKQFYDRRPLYKVLDQAGNRIRLFRIIPTEDDSTVRVRLVEADITASKYTAISYVWGQHPRMKDIIWVNSQPFKVTATIFRFLQKAKRECMDDLYWVDCICIHHSHVIERLHQFSIMRQICSGATKVVVWLDEVEQKMRPPDQRNVDSAKAIHHAVRTFINVVDEETARLINIATNQYWNRLLIVQQLFFARDVTILSESHEIDIDKLTSMYHMTLFCMKESGLADTDPFTNMGRVLDLHQSHKQKHDLVKLETLLQAFRFQQSRDPRNRIYGLIGMTNLADKLPTDYNKSLVEVFLDVVTSLGEERTLSILPLLIQALEVRLYDGNIFQKVSRTPLCKYEFEQEVHPLPHSMITRLSVSAEGQGLIESDTTDLVCLTTEYYLATNGGLVFVKQSQCDTTPSQCQYSYKPSVLYTYDDSGPCVFVKIPSLFRKALADTHAQLISSESSTPRVRISTDQQGAVALGFCIQAKGCGLAPVFECVPRPPEQSIRHTDSTGVPDVSKLNI